MTKFRDEGIHAMATAAQRGENGSAVFVRAELGSPDDSGSNWFVSTQWLALNDMVRAEPVEVTIGFGRPAIDRQPVTASVIRQLPLGEMLDLCRRALHDESHHRIETDPLLSDSGDGVEYGKFTGAGPQRGAAVTEEQTKAVAEVYRRAWSDGQPVTAAVADFLNVSDSTATKRIMKARAAGLLDGIGPKR